MAEPQRAKARKPHHKTRTGCLQCKQRKVKCDEEKPLCKKCKRQGASCSFLQTHPIRRQQLVIQPVIDPSGPCSTTSDAARSAIQYILSPDPISTTPSDSAISESSYSNQTLLHPVFTMLDLELLHFYTTESVMGYLEPSSFIDLFRTTVVQLAVENRFLMHSLLSLAAIHLAHLRPEKRSLYRHASDSHAATGLSLFQPQISNLTAENCHACFAFASIIFAHAWAIQDLSKPSSLFFRPVNADVNDVETNIRWVKLHRGSEEILRTRWSALSKGPLSLLFAVWKDLDPDREDPLLEEEQKHLDELVESWEHTPSLSATEKEVLNDALGKTKRIFSMLTVNPEFGRLPIAMSWFASTSDKFLQMLEEKIPQALLIATYYCVVLKALDPVWWMEGKAENLLKTILDVLDDEWKRWTQWPIKKVMGEGVEM